MMDPNVSYTSHNTYTVLNKEALNSTKTINVWLALHGMGYLSKYFIKYFSALNSETNYIIAPQAPSKYYQDKKFKYVGASWLTKENTELEKQNVYAYLDAVWHTESKKWEDNKVRFIFMGYSQGVSIITRWMLSRKISCDSLLLHSGAIPKELDTDSFSYLPESTPVTYLYGTEDEYINEARMTEQQLIGSKVFGERLHIVTFDGKHEVNTDYLEKLSLEIALIS